MSHGTKGKGDIRDDLVTQHSQHCVSTKAHTTQHHRKINKMQIWYIGVNISELSKYLDMYLSVTSGLVVHITDPH